MKTPLTRRQQIVVTVILQIAILGGFTLALFYTQLGATWPIEGKILMPIVYTVATALAWPELLKRFPPK